MTIVARPTSENFWWGIYGLTEGSSWDDVRLLKRNAIAGEADERLDLFCVCTRAYLEEELEELTSQESEADFVEMIRGFLRSADPWFVYSYLIPEENNLSCAEPAASTGLRLTLQPKEPWFTSSHLIPPADELPAAVSDTGERYTEIWLNDKYLTVEGVVRAATAYCQQMWPEVVHEVLVDYPDPIEIARSFQKHAEQFGSDFGNGSIIFADEVVVKLATVLQQSPEAIRTYLHRIAGGPNSVV